MQILWPHHRGEGVLAQLFGVHHEGVELIRREAAVRPELEGKGDRLRALLADGVLYMTFPEGIGASKLNLAAVTQALGVRSTARNWNTVQKLAKLTPPSSH